MEPLKDKGHYPADFSLKDVLKRGASEETEIRRSLSQETLAVLKRSETEPSQQTKPLNPKRVSLKMCFLHHRSEDELFKKLNGILTLFKSEPVDSINELIDLFVRSSLELTYQRESYFSLASFRGQNQEFSPRSHALRQTLEEETPHLDPARARLKSLLETVQSFESQSTKTENLKQLFHNLVKTKNLKSFVELIEDPNLCPELRKWALEAIFLSETNHKKGVSDLKNWLSVESSTKIKEVVVAYFYELQSLSTKYSIHLSNEHKIVLSHVRAREIVRCFYTSRVLFDKIIFNGSEIMKLDDFAKCDPLLHFFGRLIFNIYTFGLYPTGEAAQAMEEARALKRFSEVDWTAIEQLLTQNPIPFEEIKTKIDLLNLSDDTLRSILQGKREAIFLEAAIMNEKVPTAPLLRLSTPTAWNMFDENFRIRFKGLWKVPYWTRPLQNIRLDIQITSIGEYCVLQERTYGVYKRLNPNDPLSTTVDTNTCLAEITIQSSYMFSGMGKGVLTPYFQIKELSYTSFANAKDKKTITQSLVNYNAEEEVKLAAALEPRLVYSH